MALPSQRVARSLPSAPCGCTRTIRTRCVKMVRDSVPVKCHYSDLGSRGGKSNSDLADDRDDFSSGAFDVIVSGELAESDAKSTVDGVTGES